MKWSKFLDGNVEISFGIRLRDDLPIIPLQNRDAVVCLVRSPFETFLRNGVRTERMTEAVLLPLSNFVQIAATNPLPAAVRDS